MATQTFKEAYGVLQQHAQTLRNQQEPNIDDLLSIVTESVDAFKVCKARIDAVENALEKALSDTAAAPKDSVLSAKTPSTPAQGDPDLDSDVPF